MRFNEKEMERALKAFLESKLFGEEGAAEDAIRADDEFMREFVEFVAEHASEFFDTRQCKMGLRELDREVISGMARRAKAKYFSSGK